MLIRQPQSVTLYIQWVLGLVLREEFVKKIASNYTVFGNEQTMLQSILYYRQNLIDYFYYYGYQ